MHDKELIKHPEGGRFKEVYRSRDSVTQGGRKRDALTHIYFSLKKHEVSRFHKVGSDEVWNLYEGRGLTLYLWDDETDAMKQVELSAEKREYCCVVPAGLWQAAVPFDDILLGCSVSPGFEFDDFELIDPKTETAQTILSRFPGLGRLIYPDPELSG